MVILKLDRRVMKFRILIEAFSVSVCQSFRSVHMMTTLRDPSEKKIVEEFLDHEEIEDSMRIDVLKIIKGMGFKAEHEGQANVIPTLEFQVVQDADRLDAIGAIGN
ncbi:unnamed protein product [Cuscuta epithymum]|uniref:Uncharacterized protein n=1 Tax=Cuscuta epithymum TaxID=186058 RepID=A0AAV0FXD3_9ASTE|nr:unnamed protein product [Cuscuta epithymum]